MKSSGDFDRIASAYRWLEYATLGPMLERVRSWWLDREHLAHARRVLILGDGDGRFTQRLLEQNPQARVTAVDLSRRMLKLLERRCAPWTGRLRTVRADLREVLPPGQVDLVVSHFVLDTLTEDEVHDLVPRVRAHLQPNARWIVSEFALPRGQPMRWVAWTLVRSLYLAFHLLTGLQVTRLPDYAQALQQNGFALEQAQSFLGGILVTQIWRLQQRSPGTGPGLQG